MKIVFVLHHTVERSNYDDSKLIGVYSSDGAAKQAIERLRYKPGFKSEGRFTVDRYTIDEDNWVEGFGVGDD
jgi:hypothetical protein